MAWIILTIAGLFEVIWAAAMKESQGFTKLEPTLITFLAMGISFGLLAWALRTIPVGTGYAVWTGIGALGSVIAGILLFKEPATAFRLISAAMILAGIVGLKLSA